MRYLAPLTLLSLTACDPGSSSVVVQIVCPHVAKYDVATQNRALSEYQKLPPDSALRQMIGDYKLLRDQIMVCRAGSGVR